MDLSHPAHVVVHPVVGCRLFHMVSGFSGVSERFMIKAEVEVGVAEVITEPELVARVSAVLREKCPGIWQPLW